MKKYLFLFLIFPIYGIGQTNSNQVWTEIGLEGSFTKKFSWAADVTTRFGNLGVNTFFPQIAVKYKVTKWFRPSVDFRTVFNHQKDGNYDYSNRLNINADFKKVISKVELGFRLRYQYSFGSVFSAGSYDPDFDQAIRFKPSISYDIKKSILTPVISAEFFYDPSYSQYGRQFTKIRTFVGVKMDWKKPFDISAGYIFDGKMNVPKLANRHILALSFSYKIGEEK